MEVMRPPMFDGPIFCHCAVPGAGGNVLRARARSCTSEWTDGSRTGQATRARNHTLRALWFDSRTPGPAGFRFLRGPGVILVRDLPAATPAREGPRLRIGAGRLDGLRFIFQLQRTRI